MTEAQLDRTKSMSSSTTTRRRRTRSGCLFWLGMCLLVSSPRPCDSFVPTERTSTSKQTTTTARHMVHDYDLRDPDMMELMLGGMKYENVPLPDSMMDTTVFVGNLCEFAKDEDLSGIFRSVTNLQSLPACVARRPNYQSLQYGFVAFPTVEEKEAAIIRFHGREFMGRKIKVEEILDHPSKGRVNVPEKLVTYVLGRAKKIPRGKNDFSLRKTSNPSKSKRGLSHNSNSADAASYGSNNNSNNKTQGRRKGDRKQNRANHKKRRRRNKDLDFFY